MSSPVPPPPPPPPPPPRPPVGGAAPPPPPAGGPTVPPPPPASASVPPPPPPPPGSLGQVLPPGTTAATRATTEPSNLPPAPAAAPPAPAAAPPAPEAAPAPSPPPPPAPSPPAPPPSGPPPPAPAAPSPQPTSRAAPKPAESRTTSTDLSDLLSQLGDGTDGHVDADGPLTDPRDLERPGDTARVVVESTGAINYQPEFASFAARAGGWAIDTAVTTAALIPGLALLLVADGAVKLLALPLLIISFVAVAWSYTASIARSGQWVGNRVMSTTVVRVANGKFIDRPQAFTRFAVRTFISPVFAAGFIMALTNSSRRTFHDQIAESIVTRPARASWSIDDGGDPAADGSPK